MSTTDEQAIREVLTTYAQSLNDADAQAAVAVYAEDGVFYPYNLPTATGTTELLASYEQIFRTIKLEIAFTIDQVVVDGDLAYAATSSAGQVTVLEPGITVPESNREVFVLVRRDDTWKVAQYMFNKSEAPAAPGA